MHLDFQKAFDKVPHQRLLSKSKAYGIRGKVFDWIEIFFQEGNKELQFVGLILTGLMLLVAYLKVVF